MLSLKQRKLVWADPGRETRLPDFIRVWAFRSRAPYTMKSAIATSLPCFSSRTRSPRQPAGRIFRFNEMRPSRVNNGENADSSRLAMKTFIASLLFAVSATAQLSFETASIKLNVSGDRSSFTRRGVDSLALQNWPLRDIVLKAYDLKSYALEAPDWLASRNFDLNAKASGKATEDELRQMLQALLKDRFQLKAHPAQKDLRAYVLLPTKGGLKLSSVHDNGVFGVDVSRFPDRTRIVCRHCTMDKVAEVLADHVGVPVVDQSGMAEEYSFTLEWSPSQNANDTGPSIFTALNEQLGMRLEPRRMPISILVVDSILRTPSDN